MNEPEDVGPEIEPADYFRCENMCLCELIIHQDYIFQVIERLGKAGLVHFVNLNANVNIANLEHSRRVQNCYVLRKDIDVLWKIIEEETDIPILFYPDIEEIELRQFDVRQVEINVKKLQHTIEELEKNYAELLDKYTLMLEKLSALRHACHFFEDFTRQKGRMTYSNELVASLLQQPPSAKADDEIEQRKLDFIIGSIDGSRLEGFERMVWRITLGNCIFRSCEIPPVEEYGGKNRVQKQRYAFILFFFGAKTLEKVLKICEGYHCNVFTCPRQTDGRSEMLEALGDDLQQAEFVLQKMDEHKHDVLSLAAAELHIWSVQVQMMLQIYMALNWFKRVDLFKQEKFLTGECWVPCRDFRKLQSLVLEGAFAASENELLQHPPLVSKVKFDRTKRTPPTRFYTNKYTVAFQKLVEAYGIATYGEFNPAPYTMVTFPFVFATMFGDVGHGTLIVLFSVYMIYWEKYYEHQRHISLKRNEIWDMIFTGRYVILLLGIYSIYAGVIYNDFFSHSILLFNSQWNFPYNMSTVMDNKELQLDSTDKQFNRGYPYVFGIDPLWDEDICDNGMSFVSSIKMKLSISIGVIHMMLGLCIGALNLIHMHRYVDLCFVWVPKMLFMICVFLQLVVHIFLKWVSYGGIYPDSKTPQCAPSLLVNMVNTFLMTGKDRVRECQREMYEGQIAFQNFMFVVTVLCIPVLCVGKPLVLTLCYAMYVSKADRSTESMESLDSRTSLERRLTYSAKVLGTERTLEVPTAETWLQQAIYAVEYCLAAISHAASYLRIWAISLAHTQLSEVLHDTVLSSGMSFSNNDFINGLATYVTFFVWAFATVTIIIIMEGLTAFLHTLRLHWVEFQSKFYEGAGEPFKPFKFKRRVVTI